MASAGYVWGYQGEGWTNILFDYISNQFCILSFSIFIKEKQLKSTLAPYYVGPSPRLAPTR